MQTWRDVGLSEKWLLTCNNRSVQYPNRREALAGVRIARQVTQLQATHLQPAVIHRESLFTRPPHRPLPLSFPGDLTSTLSTFHTAPAIPSRADEQRASPRSSHFSPSHSTLRTPRVATVHRILSLSLGLLLICGCQDERPARVEIANVPFVESNIGEIQATYQQLVADLQTHMEQTVAVRTEITDVWQFAVREERSHRLEQAFTFFHTHDPEQRLQKLRQQRDHMQQQLTQLGAGQQSSLVRNWHRGTTDLLAHNSALLDGCQSPTGTAAEFAGHTQSLKHAFTEDLAALRTLLDSPIH